MMYRPNRFVFRRVSLFVMTIFFMIGNISAGYHICAMDTTVATQAMAGMEDCNMQLSNVDAPISKKKCCIDFSCLKCFSTFLYGAAPEKMPTSAMRATLTFQTPDHFSKYPSSTPERPPKTG